MNNDNPTLEEVTKQRDDLARDVIWAVNFLDCRGGGLIMSRDGGLKAEHWLARFRRHLAPLGIEWDDDMLEYGRGSQKLRKEMLKDPAFAKKLADAQQARQEARP